MQTDLRMYDHKESTEACPSNGSRRLSFYSTLPQLFEGSKLQLFGISAIGDGWSALEVIDVVITFMGGALTQIVTCKPGCLTNPDVPYWAGRGSATNAQEPVLPRINIKCVTSLNIPSLPHAGGATSLPVVRVEPEDDGSYTAVTDYWPKDLAGDNTLQEIEELERLAVSYNLGCRFNNSAGTWEWYNNHLFEEYGSNAVAPGFRTRVDALKAAIEGHLTQIRLHPDE